LRIYLRFIFYFSKNILGFPTLLLESQSPQQFSPPAPQQFSDAQLFQSLKYSKPSTTQSPQHSPTTPIFSNGDSYPIVMGLYISCKYLVEFFWWGYKKKEERCVISPLGYA
jgi:hypothetical protein